MIVQASAWGMMQVKGARKCQRHPPHPQQNDRISTRNVHRPETSFGKSQHISAKYIRYLKLLKGKSVTITDLGIFSQFDGILSSIENVVTSTFQAIKNCFHIDTPVNSSKNLANCNLANLLVCRTKRLSFNRTTSSKTKKFFGKITSKFVGN